MGAGGRVDWVGGELVLVVQEHWGERGRWLRWGVEVVPVDRAVHHLVSVVPIFVSVVSLFVSVVSGRLVLSEIVSVCQRGVSV